MTSLPARRGVVFDCNIFVQAVAFENGPAAEALRRVESGQCELFISTATMAELRRVLEYEEVLALSGNMTPLRIAAFLERVAFRATLRRRPRRVFHFARDPNDEPYLDLAHSVSAHYLVSRDRDLLSLMTGHSTFCKEFRQKTYPLKIVGPVEFLDLIGRKGKPERN